MKDKKVIGFCFSGINPEYQHIILNSVCNEAQKLGFRVFIFNSLGRYVKGNAHDKGEINIFNLINFDLLAGLVILTETISHKPTVDKLVREARLRDIPVVTVDGRVDGCYNFVLSNSSGFEKIVRHFVEFHKFSRVAIVSGIPDNDVSERRIEIYKKVLLENNIPVREEYIKYGMFWHIPAQNAAQELMQLAEPPEAIVFANDAMAVAAAIRLSELGFKIPDDVCVSGFDGLEIALNHDVPITTASSAVDSIGIEAVRVIDRVLKGEKQETEISLEPQMNYAKSCGCNEISFTRPKLTKYDFYINHNGNNIFYSQMIRLNELMTGAKSLEQAADFLERSARHAWCQRLWIYIIDDFIKTSHNLDEIYGDQNYLKEGYSKNMNLFLSMRERKRVRTDPETLDVAELFPEREKNHEEFPNMMFFPLHFRDRTIGYLAMDYRPLDLNFYFMHSWLMNISTNLENLRREQEISNLALKYQRLYITDSLTGLYNRRGFYKKVSAILPKCVEDGAEVMVISIDLDDLKPINDLFGHAQGDVAITIVSTSILSMGDNYISARFGGDEFIVLGVGCGELEAKRFTEHFQMLIDTYNIESDKPYMVSASCGFHAGRPKMLDDIDEFIKIADEEMYTTKSARKSHKNYRNRKR